MSWRNIKLGEVINHRKEFITIGNSIEYKRCRVQVNRKGVVLRDVIKGILINTKKQQVCKEGDFLVAEIDAKVGGYGFVPKELEGAIVSSHYFLFDVDETKMLKSYLAWIIKTDIIQEQINSKGSTNYAAIRPSHVLSFEIPLPSLKEQKVLIARINNIDAEYSLLKIELNNQQNYLSQLRQAILQEAVQGKLSEPGLAGLKDVRMKGSKKILPSSNHKNHSTDKDAATLLQHIKAEKQKEITAGKLKKEKELPPITEDEIPFELPKGWVWCRLGEIINLVSGVTLGKMYKEEVIEVPYLRVANVQRGYVDITHLKELAVPRQEIEKYALKKGDLVMIEGGDWDKVGRCAIWNEEVKPCIHQNHIFRLRFYGKISNQWAELFLNSPVARRYFESCSKQTTNLASINKTQLTNLLFALPPLSEQRRIVAKVQQLLQMVNQLEQQVQQSQAQISQLLQAVLKEAFSWPTTASTRGARKVKEYEENEMVTMAAEPELNYNTQHSVVPVNKKGFAKQVLGGKIVSLFKDDKNFTRIKFQKLQYLAEHTAEEDLLWNYYQQVAGPYDNRFMHTVAAMLKKNKWFEERHYKFYSLQKADDIEGYYQNYFGAKRYLLDELFNLFKTASEKFCEAIATIYGVWNNHIILQQPFKKEKIKTDFFDWSTRKENVFTEIEFEKALEWMQNHKIIIPKGFGSLIKRKGS